jgi:hypothetical protein
MSFLSELQNAKTLRRVDEADKSDRSHANVTLVGKDVLDDEASRWKYFFDSGCGTWFECIKEYTFTSTFCDIVPDEAKIIVDHWEERRRCLANLVANGQSNPTSSNSSIVKILERAMTKLQPLKMRLNKAVQAEVQLSSVGQAFVKLSTRSPKDSKKALAKAQKMYSTRLAEAEVEARAGGHTGVDANTRWRILCEETTRSGAVSTGSEALELLLDSERVWEDLEYALRGPPADGNDESAMTAAAATPAMVGGVVAEEQQQGPDLTWNINLVARSWDPRLKPESEFRGICWGGKLTCLCQYFHPIYFSEVEVYKHAIEKDILALFKEPKVKAAVARLGGHCIIDFAWLGPSSGKKGGCGDEGKENRVIIVELNPFDGVCLGTFPASTGLFLWDHPDDRKVMKGEKPFEFRTRTEPLQAHQLKSQCNPDWRDIIYERSVSSGRD